MSFSGRSPFEFTYKTTIAFILSTFSEKFSIRRFCFTKKDDFGIIMIQASHGLRRTTMKDELYEKTEYALSLIREGNDAGVDLLYSFMGKIMFMIARGVVRDACLAEDVVQESFLKIVKNIDRYKKGTNAYSWVCRIVRNTALNALKSSQNRPTEDIDEFFGLSDGADLEEKTTTRLLAEKLMNSLSPPIVKQMIYMKYFLDMTVREIAKEIGKSKSYVAKEISKTEEFMKKLL